MKEQLNSDNEVVEFDDDEFDDDFGEEHSQCMHIYTGSLDIGGNLLVIADGVLTEEVDDGHVDPVQKRDVTPLVMRVVETPLKTVEEIIIWMGDNFMSMEPEYTSYDNIGVFINEVYISSEEIYRIWGENGIVG